jgi:hypothetical protein
LSTISNLFIKNKRNNFFTAGLYCRIYHQIKQIKINTYQYILRFKSIRLISREVTWLRFRSSISRNSVRDPASKDLRVFMLWICYTWSPNEVRVFIFIVSYYWIIL